MILDKYELMTTKNARASRLAISRVLETLLFTFCGPCPRPRRQSRIWQNLPNRCFGAVVFPSFCLQGSVRERFTSFASRVSNARMSANGLNDSSPVNRGRVLQMTCWAKLASGKFRGRLHHQHPNPESSHECSRTPQPALNTMRIFKPRISCRR